MLYINKGKKTFCISWKLLQVFEIKIKYLLYGEKYLHIFYIKLSILQLFSETAILSYSGTVLFLTFEQGCMT